jgi:glycosyltransferase involved in cell wall biosynthesis
MQTPQTPSVSVILPTYNRADTLDRALDSVVGQWFEDWELIVVDDGSQDHTVELVQQRRDPRIRLVTQDNAGVYVARNRGLAEARGRLITFLDSDDAWRPHYLSLTTAFLASAPDQAVVTTEFHQDFGAHVERHDHHSISRPYLRFAHQIGSNGLDLPPGERDDYLRVYAQRHTVGAWGQDIVQRLGLPQAHWYSGRIFRHMRWGYLHWLPITMVRREAVDAIGPFSTRTRNAADFQFLGRLARQFTFNMIAIPSAIKYERAMGNRQVHQGHLATGANSYSFEVNKLSYFDELFAAELPGDPELQTVRCHYEYFAGYAALRKGDRQAAARHFARAARWRPHLRRAYAYRVLVGALPSDAVAARLVESAVRVEDLVRRVAIGETSVGELWRKAGAKLKARLGT